ncbi:MAG TPA: phage integrase SAM-like domain-containing protein [Saprospiraceae bacterium]|nr:phage integrase SAM-like domain-containing protein [Saprospiraceae bacterium]HMQ83456.1 phage integrase SAM-like domain-containing protein [Saprospiraceae bacterium]
MDTKNNRGYIILIYRYNYQGQFIKLKYWTGEYVEPKYWDKKASRAKFTNSHPEYIELNRKLNELDGIAVQIYKDNNSGDISPNDFKNEIAYRIGDKPRPVDASNHIPTFPQFMDQFIAEQKTKKKTNTWKKYSSPSNHLKAFAEETNIKLDYNTIDWRFRTNFIDWLYAPPRKHSTNNVAKIIGTIRLFLKESHRAGYHTNEIFKDSGFAVREVRTKNKVRLSLEELEALASLDLSGNERLEKVRDLFLVGAFSGLRFSDWHKITKEQLYCNSEGSEMIRILAEKTRKYTSIPLLPELKQILEKYNYQLPKISSQRFNDYIKEVCELVLSNATFMRIYSEGGQIKSETAQKWEFVSSHAARRSFVSNFLQLGIRPDLIRQITGHSTERQLYAYADIDADELAANFGKEAITALENHRKKVKAI